jgi:uncharacterized protein (TIGR03067 family)
MMNLYDHSAGDLIVRATLVLVVPWIIGLLWRRASAAERHLMWSLALAALIVLLVCRIGLPELRLAVLPAASSPAPLPVAAPSATPPVPERASNQAPRSLPNQAPKVSHADMVVAPMSEAAETVSAPLRISILAWVWIAGAVLSLALVGVRHFALGFGARRWSELTDPAIIVLTRRAAEKLHVSLPRVLEAEPQAMPMVWCWRRPTLALPATASGWPPEQLWAVLLHELAHIKRRDCLTQFVGQIACAVYWFHPLAWLALAQMVRERERACDDLVLGAGVRPSDYTSTLVAVAREYRENRILRRALPVARPSHLRERIQAILDTGRQRKVLGARSALVLSLTLVAAGAFIATAQPTARAVAGDTQQHTDAPDIRGTWSATVTQSVFTNSKQHGPKTKTVTKTITYVISDDRFLILGDDGLIDHEWVIHLDPSSNPKAIDLVDRRIGTLQGIYELGKDGLLRVRTAPGNKRPTDFTGEGWDLRRVSTTPMKTAQRFANAPGCLWMIEPMAPPVSMSTLGIVFIYEQDSAGAAVITMAGVLPGPSAPEYRPVLFDGKKNRYLPESLGGGGSGREGAAVSLCRWRMDPRTLPAQKVTLIGIEALTPESHRDMARQAFEKARQAGVQVFPYPETGQTFEFDVATIDGKKINSEKLRGHVVVIDFWASWCAPCMHLLPDVRQLYDRWHKEGLEVISVSLDNDAEAVKKTCQRLNLSWPQVLVTADQKQRELWQEASGIGPIPRLLVIDRQGVLRLDLGGKVDEEQIVALLKGASSRSK